MDALASKTGFRMRDSDNKYHVHVPPIRRYSQDGIDLLLAFERGDTLPDLNDPLVTGEIVKNQSAQFFTGGQPPALPPMKISKS